MAVGRKLLEQPEHEEGQKQPVPTFLAQTVPPAPPCLWTSEPTSTTPFCSCPIPRHFARSQSRATLLVPKLWLGTGLEALAFPRRPLEAGASPPRSQAGAWERA